MAKVAVVLAAVLVAFLALAEASSYTIVTTVEEETSQGGQHEQSQRCSQHKQQLRHCQQYLSPQRQLARAMINQQGQEFQHFSQCCGALMNIGDVQCRCELLDDIVRQQSEQGSRGGQQEQSRQQMAIMASYLPLFCSLGHVCSIQAAVA